MTYSEALSEALSFRPDDAREEVVARNKKPLLEPCRKCVKDCKQHKAPGLSVFQCLVRETSSQKLLNKV